MPLIEVKNLSKVYRTNVKAPGLKGTVRNLFHSTWVEKLAIDNISFSMQEGEALACIGENGAGKSTLIKMLVGILNPTGGDIRVYQQNPMDHHQLYLRKIGVLFGQKTNLWWDIPVIESYRAIKVLYKLNDQEYRRNMDAVAELLDLGPILSSPARKLSLGQRMKADIGLIFLHSPKILFLDEPTIGLDINIKHSIRRFIKTMNKENGVSVFLTSHDLDDIDAICDNALVLSKGKIFYHGALEQLKQRYASNKTVIVSGQTIDDISRALPEAQISVDGQKTKIIYDAKKYSSGDILRIVSECYDIDDITIQDPDIDYVVSQIFTEGAKSGVAE
jgi:ABC-2 type transport system ATP-binding protein